MLWRRRQRPEDRILEPIARYRDFPVAYRAAFERAGVPRDRFFPHRVRIVERAGADGFYLARAIHGVADPGSLMQVVLHATGEALDGIPADLFFDDDVVWHRQHLGLPGHVAAANLALRGRDLLTTARYADVVQRSSRRPAVANRVRRRFRGWDILLLNAILEFAIDVGARRIVLPTAATALAHTDRARDPSPEMFDRIYDRHVLERYPAVRKGGAWIVKVAEARERLVPSERGIDRLDDAPTICICHDTERELGHVTADPSFVPRARQVAESHIDRILEVEAGRDVRGTFAVVGSLLPDLRPRIERGGHELAFHSFDHDVSREQLLRCREVDYRIRGYRPPQSLVTAELTDVELSRRNFEWLASSPSVMVPRAPTVRSGVARVPVLFDDFPLHREATGWDAWEEHALRTVRSNPVATFGLHDCYADRWIDRLDGFLAKLRDLGEPKPIGAVADRLFLRTGR